MRKQMYKAMHEYTGVGMVKLGMDKVPAHIPATISDDGEEEDKLLPVITIDKDLKLEQMGFKVGDGIQLNVIARLQEDGKEQDKGGNIRQKTTFVILEIGVVKP